MRTPGFVPWLGGLLALAAASPAAAQPFYPTLVFPVGTFPRSIVTADFNADGHADFATANTSGNSLSIGLGNGTGGLIVMNTVPLAVPVLLAVGDFNGDGKLDLVVNHTSGSAYAVSFLLGDGAGGFGAPDPANDVTGLSFLSYVLVADFNGDLKSDVAVSGNAADGVSILLGNGAGGVTPASTFGPAQAWTMAAADFNRDGHVDLAVPDRATGNLSILLGDGTGHFSANSFPSGASSPTAVLAADFNHDFRTDLVVGYQNSGPMKVLLGDGAGGFGAPLIGPPTGPGNFPASMATADWNEDGNLDFAIASLGTSGTVWPGDGAGGFGAATTVGGVCVAVADFDENGHVDVLTAAAGVAVHLNKVDTDGDTILDLFDNCPTVPNTDQLDYDTDDVGDVCDNCVPLANTSQEDKNHNGVGDVCDAIIAVIRGAGDIEAIQAELDALTARVAALDASETAQNDDIALLKREVADLEAKVAFLLKNLPPGKRKVMANP